MRFLRRQSLKRVTWNMFLEWAQLLLYKYVQNETLNILRINRASHV